MNTQNKYVDSILDNMNKYGKITDTDKEYLSKINKGEDTTELEKDYDLFEEFRSKIFDRKPNPDWEFFISKGHHETMPIFYDKETGHIKQRGSVNYDYNDSFNVLILNPEQAEKANKCMHDELQDFLFKIIMETDTYVNGEYVGYNKKQILKNLNKMNVSFDKKINNDNTIDIKIWDFESKIKLKLILR